MCIRDSDKAHSLGMIVAAHVESPEGVMVALQNGVDSIEHGAQPSDEMITLFKQRKAFQISTISPALPYALFDRSISHATYEQQENGKIVFDGIIALNGQYCFDDHGLLEKESLLPEDIVTITRWLDEHPDVVANYCEKDYVYFNQITDAMRATWRQLGKTAPTVNIDDPHERALKYETFQISPYISFEDEAKLSGMCRNVRGVRWHPDFTDLIPADGGKPEGMKRFMRHYGWTREQTIAFGDGGNDADMLAFAGIGVAMGNATEPAKAAADYITDDVDHDGIMNALKHFNVL